LTSFTSWVQRADRPFAGVGRAHKNPFTSMTHRNLAHIGRSSHCVNDSARHDETGLPESSYHTPIVGARDSAAPAARVITGAATATN